MVSCRLLQHGVIRSVTRLYNRGVNGLKRSVLGLKCSVHGLSWSVYGLKRSVRISFSSAVPAPGCFVVLHVVVC